MKKDVPKDATMKNQRPNKARKEENSKMATKMGKRIRQKSKDGLKKAKILHAYDSTYHIPIVYAYADFKTYGILSKALFKNPCQSKYPAKGLAVFGSGASRIGYVASLIWINSEIPLEKAFSTFIHEIVHLSQDILRQAHVADESGEVQAYMVQRETRRILHEFYGMAIDRDDDEVLRAVKDVVEGKLNVKCAAQGRSGSPRRRRRA